MQPGQVPYPAMPDLNALDLTVEDLTRRMSNDSAAAKKGMENIHDSISTLLSRIGEALDKGRIEPHPNGIITSKLIRNEEAGTHDLFAITYTRSVEGDLHDQMCMMILKNVRPLSPSEAVSHRDKIDANVQDEGGMFPASGSRLFSNAGIKALELTIMEGYSFDTPIALTEDTTKIQIWSSRSFCGSREDVRDFRNGLTEFDTEKLALAGSTSFEATNQHSMIRSIDISFTERKQSQQDRRFTVSIENENGIKNSPYLNMKHVEVVRKAYDSFSPIITELLPRLGTLKLED